MSDEIDETKFTDDEKEVARRARRVQMLRNVNHGLCNEIEAMGGSVDLTMPRLEHLIQFLVDEEIITTKQMVDESESWEKALRPQLITARDHRKDMMQKAARAADKRLNRSGPPGTAASVGDKPKPENGGLVLPFGAKKKDPGNGEEDSQSET